MIIRRGELKSHLNESARKLRCRLPIFLLSVTSNLINAGTFYLGVCISTAAIERLEIKEQFAIIDHELGHIKKWKNDLIILFYFISPIPFIALPIALIFWTRAIFIMWLCSAPFFGLFLCLRFFKLGGIIKIKINSEFMADKTSAELGNAEALISALIKIEKYNVEQSVSWIAEHLYSFYFSDKNFYPPTNERIEKLEEFC